MHSYPHLSELPKTGQVIGQGTARCACPGSSPHHSFCLSRRRRGASHRRRRLPAAQLSGQDLPPPVNILPGGRQAGGRAGRWVRELGRVGGGGLASQGCGDMRAWVVEEAGAGRGVQVKNVNKGSKLGGSPQIPLALPTERWTHLPVTQASEILWSIVSNAKKGTRLPRGSGAATVGAARSASTAT